MSPRNERRPGDETEAAGAFRGAGPIVHASTDNRECDSLVTAGGRVWTRAEWRAYLDGYTAGRTAGLVEGHAQGRAAERDDVERLHTTAARVVLELAKLPARDAEADRARAARRAARTYYGGEA